MGQSDLFSYLSAFVTIILAVALGDMIQSSHRLIRARHRVRWDALPLLFAGIVAVAVISEFFSIWDGLAISQVSIPRLIWMLTVPTLFALLAYSTAEDMHRFALALMSGKLLSASRAKEFTSKQVEVAPAASGRPARYYGFGFGINDEGDRRWYGHNGGTLGANAEFSVQPDHGWVISVLSNRDPPTATNIMRFVRRLLEHPARVNMCVGVAK